MEDHSYVVTMSLIGTATGIIFYIITFGAFISLGKYPNLIIHACIYQGHEVEMHPAAKAFSIATQPGPVIISLIFDIRILKLVKVSVAPHTNTHINQEELVRIPIMATFLSASMLIIAAVSLFCKGLDT